MKKYTLQELLTKSLRELVSLNEDDISITIHAMAKYAQLSEEERQRVSESAIRHVESLPALTSLLSMITAMNKDIADTIQVEEYADSAEETIERLLSAYRTFIIEIGHMVTVPYQSINIVGMVLILALTEYFGITSLPVCVALLQNHCNPACNDEDYSIAFDIINRIYKTAQNQCIVRESELAYKH